MKKWSGNFLRCPSALLTVMLSPFAQFTLSEANGLRVNSTTHLALLLVGGKVQSEILLPQGGIRITAWQTSAWMLR